MSRITKTTDLGNGVTQTEENRTARVCIVPHMDGTVAITFERETVTRINGKIVGGAAPCSPVTLSDADARKVPLFATIYVALSQAGDAAEQAIADAQAKAAQDAAAQDNG